MQWLETMATYTWTAPSIILVISGFAIFAFIKGWLLTPWQIKALTDLQNLRIAELTESLRLERERNEVLVDQVRRLSVVGETTERVLRALPTKEDS